MSKSVYDFSQKNIRVQQPMQEFLQQHGKEADFTSDVYYIELNDSTKWVVKLYKSAEFKELTEIIAEVLAYIVSTDLNLGLVPETHAMSYNGTIGTAQRYIESVDKAQYSDLLAQNERQDVQLLKLFWFILRQWDTSLDNVLFSSDNKPIAIDNANIAYIQQLEKYGSHPFSKLYYCEDVETQGSLQKPIIIKGTLEESLKQLSYNLVTIPTWLFEQAPKNTNITFTYFVEDNWLWRNFSNEEESLYFIPQISPQILKKFKSDKWNSIFNTAIDELLEITKTITLPTFEIPHHSSGLEEALKYHFFEIAKDVEKRIGLVEYFIAQSTYLEALNTLPLIVIKIIDSYIDSDFSQVKTLDSIVPLGETDIYCTES